MNFEEFIKYCEKGYCPRGTIKSKQCKTEIKRNKCYDKYVIQQEKIFNKKLEYQEKINNINFEKGQEEIEKNKEFREKVLLRDNKECQLWKILSLKEKQYVLTNFSEDFYHERTLDVAHIEARQQSPEKIYDIDNVVLLRRYFHSLIDNLKHPITRKNIDGEKRLLILKAIKKGEWNES